MSTRRCMVCGRFAKGVFLMTVFPGRYIAWSHPHCAYRLGMAAPR